MASSTESGVTASQARPGEDAHSVAREEHHRPGLAGPLERPRIAEVGRGEHAARRLPFEPRAEKPRRAEGRLDGPAVRRRKGLDEFGERPLEAARGVEPCLCGEVRRRIGRREDGAHGREQPGNAAAAHDCGFL
jgi:hypothetical protein